MSLFATKPLSRIMAESEFGNELRRSRSLLYSR